MCWPDKQPSNNRSWTQTSSTNEFCVHKYGLRWEQPIKKHYLLIGKIINIAKLNEFT